VRLTHTALFMLVRTFPDDSLETIADRLVTRYGWTAEERRYHLDRMFDIRRTTALVATFDRISVPVVRTPANLDAFLSSFDARYVDAQRVLRDLEER